MEMKNIISSLVIKNLVISEEVIKEKMDEKRMGEIALVLAKYRIGQEGIRLNPNFKRELGNVAKATGISLDELMEFGKILVEELTEETFGKQER